MLSGDIGAGKSTVLLAIEFALFGVLRGELSGNALLRHGTQEGWAELTFRLNDNTYTIKRTLRRTKKSVEQEPGYLVVNGIKKEATPIELKSQILELIGYPEELLTKTKNLVYRYTVYTPQEEMKKILMEDKEERVALLRKIFGIDKYEKIKQNTAVYTKSLRERQRAYDALLGDFEEKKKQAEEAKTEQNGIKQQLKELLPRLTMARTQLLEAKQQLTKIEQQRQQAELLTRELHVAKTQLLTKKQQQKQVQTDLTTISQQVIQAQKELPAKIETNSNKNQEVNKQITDKEMHIRTATIKITELKTIKKQSADISQKIYALAQCPTCLQNVTTEHKHTIISTEQKKIQEIEKNLEEYSGLIKKSEEELVKLKQALEQLRQQEKEAAIAKIKIQHAEQLTERKTALEQQNNILAQEIQITTEQTTKLEQQLMPLNDLNSAYEELRKHVDSCLQQERELSIQHSTLLQKEQHIMKTLTLLEQDLERKQKAKKQLEKTQHLEQWLTDFFAPLMDVVEKHVMAKIHHEFDALFQQWFCMLVEDIMTAKLDEMFTPIIQQNGYDTEVENLSGGERTACALAYRLALNKTINSLINNIKTKDLLILDEPTDGFSTEQLDKMRDVLEQLNLNQIIIVSHEQKIESFADKIIRIAKAEHTSQITF